MPEEAQKIVELEARIRNLELLLSQRIKTPLELLKEEIARNEAVKSQYQLQKRLNERLKSVQLRPILSSKEEEEKVEAEARRTDIILLELYTALDETEQPAPVSAGADSKVSVEAPSNGFKHEAEPS